MSTEWAKTNMIVPHSHKLFACSKRPETKCEPVRSGPWVLANSLNRSPTFPCTPVLIHLFGWLNNINEHNEGRNPVWFPLCLQHSAQSMSHNHYSNYRFIEWINKWQDHYAHSNFLILLCWLVSPKYNPKYTCIGSKTKAFGNLSSLVPTEKMINLNKSWGLKSNMAFEQSTEIFTVCYYFFPFWKISNLLLPK